MHYTVYKITNKINGRYYIGKHQTDDLDDGYMGSGKLIQQAIRKYGVENFEKIILHIFDNEEEMNAAETELVEVSSETYNLCPGGKGGWGYINLNRDFSKHNQLLADQRDYSLTDWKSINSDEKRRKSKSEKMKKRWSEGKHAFIPSTKGMKFSTETRLKMSESQRGPNGQMWITNGSENKRIKRVDIIPEGWYKGRS